MKRKYTRLMAVLLALVLAFTGCAPAPSGPSLREHLNREEALQSETPAETEATQPPEELTFSQMEYVRPDVEQLELLLSEACRMAEEETDAQVLMEAVYAYFDAYDWFYTYYCLADIRYSLDMTDPYWDEEYNYCIEQSTRVDAGLEELYYALADSPCRKELESDDYFGEGFFDSYDGENNWTDEFTQLLDREAALISQYYALSAESLEYSTGSTSYYDTYGQAMGQVLADLIIVRQEIAAYWGYDNYLDYAWDNNYYRDYTPQEMEDYMAAVSRELVPIYRELADVGAWSYGYRHSEVEEMQNYVRQAAQRMGGVVWEAYEVMERRELYDLTCSENKYASSFEVYLTSFEVPFLFVYSNMAVRDWLTFAHEFGHFANDYASQGSSSGIDVLEIFSQAMEYLSLCYTDADRRLIRLKMADGLSTHVEQSAFATFEHRAYQLSSSEISVERLCRLYEEVAQEFGFESVGYDPMEFVTIPHFYTHPMYIDSYVVSNDAALQIYMLELQTQGAGLTCFMDSLDTEQSYFLAYLEEAGLESPFVAGRLEAMADMFRQQLFE